MMWRCESVDGWQADRAKVRTAFERAAPTYLEATPIQEAVARELMAGLGSPVGGPVLDVASGPGRLRRLWPWPLPQPFIEMDLSTLILRAGRDGRPVEQVCADASRLPFRTRSMAAVVSSSALQWFACPRRFMGEVARVLRKGGQFHLAFFAAGTFHELAVCTADVLGRPWALRFPEAGPLAAAAAGVGLHVLDLRRQEIMTAHADLMAFLKHLRRTGSGYGAAAPSPLAGRPTLLRRLAATYADRFPHPEGGIQVTYVATYLRGTA